MNEYVKNVLNNFTDILKNHYKDFNGTATRKQFWWFILCLLVCYLLTAFISLPLKVIGYTLTTLLTLGTIVPCVALTVRRVRDAGFDYRLGFCAILLYIYALISVMPANLLFALFGLVNFVALVILIIFCSLPTKQD